MKSLHLAIAAVIGVVGICAIKSKMSSSVTVDQTVVNDITKASKKLFEGSLSPSSRVELESIIRNLMQGNDWCLYQSEIDAKGYDIWLEMEGHITIMDLRNGKTIRF